MRKLGERLTRIKSCEYWVIAYRKRNGSGNLLREEQIEGFHLLPGKRFVTQADPFLYTHQGKNWLFYEKQNLTDMKGTLWCVNLDEPGAKPQPVLAEAFHLSYPQVFRYGRYTYLLPETRNAGEIRLYRCRQFPSEWEKVETLFSLSAVDTTLLEADSLGRGALEGQQEAKGSRVFYAFTYTEHRLEIYLCETETEHFHLIRKERIYCSEASDILRPGGAFFCEDGNVYRPVQNCTDYYGQELIINRISRLDAEGFIEEEYCRLSPGQVEIPGVRAVGIHTYNRNEQIEVIDILHREISFRVILKKIFWKLRGSRS